MKIFGDSAFGRRRRRRRATASLQGLAGPGGSYFVGQDDFVDSLRHTEPDDTYVELQEETFEEPDEDLAHRGNRMSWLRDSNYLVLVPTDKIAFTPENQWNPAHAAALYQRFKHGPRPLVRAPDARLHRITADSVRRSDEWDDEGELEYQTGMERPWGKWDAGTFYVQLLDGNHRAAAAMAAGEEYIPVSVSSNYRDDVKDEEWI